MRRKIVDNEIAMSLWDWEKNNEIELYPTNVTEGSGKKAYFRCKNGHLKFKTINKEIDKNHYCKECESISYNRSDIMSHWNWDKNIAIKLDPKYIGSESSEKAWFTCDNGHDYIRIIKSESIGHRCSICESLGYNHPWVFQMWSKKNKKSPDDYTKSSNVKVWFKCLDNDGHPDYLQSINNKVQLNQGCPYCSNKKAYKENSFGFFHPEKSAEWSSKNQKTPFEYTYGSKAKVYWKCTSDEDHPDYLQSINHKSNGYGCPACRGASLGKRNRVPEIGHSFGDVYDDALSIWSEKNQKTPFEYKPNSEDRVWFKCAINSTHPDYYQQLVKKYADGCGCPVCGRGSISKPNRIIHKRYLRKGAMLEKRVKVGDKFLYADVIIPDSKTIIEFDGAYWHKNRVDEDTRKTKTMIDYGYTVIRVRDTGLPPLSVGSSDYYEVPTDMNGYQYNSKKTRNSIYSFIKRIDSIINFEDRLDIDDLINDIGNDVGNRYRSVV